MKRICGTMRDDPMQPEETNLYHVVTPETIAICMISSMRHYRVVPIMHTLLVNQT